MPRKPDQEWFASKLKRSKFSSWRDLAPHITTWEGKPMDQAALSRVFKGIRGLEIKEARQLAKLLGVSREGVSRHIDIESS
jgi:hypothetical protein